MLKTDQPGTPGSPLREQKGVQIITKRQLPYFWYLPDNSQEANGGALDINVG